MVQTLKRPLEIAEKNQASSPPDTSVLTEEVDSEKYFKNEILILISAPLLDDNLQPIEALSIQKEIDDIVDILKNIHREIEVEIIVKIATTESITEAFSNRINPLIIHFIGHGMKSEEGISLLLEDSVGRARPFSASDLRNLLRHRQTPPSQVALLNACHSQGLAAELLNAGVSHVVAVNAEDPILDLAARCFAKIFYAALFNSYAVMEAFEQGQSAVMVNDDLEKLINPQTFRAGVNLEEAPKFRLLPANSQVHQGILELQSLARGNIIAPRWENTNIASEDPTFIGRRIEIHYIAVALMEEGKPHCIALHGMGGMGKTVLAIAAGRWQHERRRWRDGVWFIDLRNVDSADTARAKVINTLLLDTNAVERGMISNNGMIEALRDLNLLLILDDVDLLLQQDTQGLVDLLNALLSCRRLRLLVTSRLVLPPEVFYESKEIQTIEGSTARQIFRKYAPSQEQWNLEEDSESDWEALMDFLDGYPLAIQIAAAYMKQRRCSLHKLWERLQNEPCQTLRPTLYQENKKNSLVAALNLSYNVLPPGAKEMFPKLALFPGGLTEEAAKFIFGRNSEESLEILLLYSMAEKKMISSPWRLPEPARRYAEEKQLPDSMATHAPRVLEYYYSFAQRLNDLLVKEDISQQDVQQQIFTEQSNLKHFLNWGYEQERSKDGICRSARITANLGNYWKWVIPGEDPLHSIESAVQVARRNQDKLGEADLYKTKGDVQQLRQGLEVAKESYSQAIEGYESVSKDLNSDSEKAQIQKKIGMIWEIYPDEEKALGSYLTAFDLYDSEGEVLEAAHIKMVVGDIQQSGQKLEEALKSYQEALERYKSKKYQAGIIKAENRIRKIQPFSASQNLLFEFETVTVNHRGKIIKRATKQAQYFNEDLGKGITLEMVAIPGNTFIMGSSKEEGYDYEKPQHQVTVPSFFMGKYPITQAQWRAIASREDLKVERDLEPNPSWFKDRQESVSRPVEQVSWYDAVEFCARLSKQTGKEYRLPSEAEWEYACRAGTTTPFHFGETITGNLANYDAMYTFADEPKEEYRKQTTPIGQFLPNAFGLYDMHGNVYEWCLDDWHSNYEGAPTDGSPWFDSEDDNLYQKTGTAVLRGGSWDDNSESCRSAYRDFNNRVVRDGLNDEGFRVVCGFGRSLR